ncbi:MAG: hypothetical protein Q8K32_30355 [Archangium sp.]|nr:hypothetical protein [Archangium sp.]
MLVASLSMTAATCSGAEGEVPARFVAFNADDAAWLEKEVSEWVSERGRSLCAARSEDEALTLDGSAQLEAVIEFDFNGAHRTRTVLRGTESAELFRYQVAATAEELVRSTWEAPPPPRFSVLVRGEFTPFGTGTLGAGGSLGVGLFVLPTWCLELMLGGGALLAQTLPTGGTVSGALARGTLSASWLPVQLGIFRAGPRASVQAGVLSTRVNEEALPATTGLTPWLGAGGGLTLGIATRHVMVQLFGEVGALLLGTTVLSEGLPVHQVRGVFGTAGLQAGWLW